MPGINSLILIRVQQYSSSVGSYCCLFFYSSTALRLPPVLHERPYTFRFRAICYASSGHSLHKCFSVITRFRASQSFERLSLASRTSSWNRHRKHSTRLGSSRAQQPTQRVSRGKQTSLGNSDPFRKLAWWLMPSEDRRDNTR